MHTKFPLWIEIPVSRTFLYLSFRFPSIGAPPLKVPLTELPYKAVLHFQSAPSSVSQRVPFKQNSRTLPNRAPMDRVAHFQSLLLNVCWFPQ
jgi:hypothetical protein